MSVLAFAKVVLTGDTIELTRAMKGAEAALVQAGQRMQSIGSKLSMALTLPMVGAGAAGVRMAAQLDDSFRLIEGLVGVSRQQLEEWEGAVRKMALETGRSAQEAAEALYFITSSGIDTAHAMDVLGASMKAAAAGLGNAQVLADAATSAMNAYGVANLSAEQALDVMVMAVREGKLEADALAPVLGRLLPLASAMGISFNQVAGVLAVMSRTGLDAAEAATALRAIMSTLLGTSEEGERVLAGAGLSLEYLRQVAAGPNGLIDVLRILDTTFDGQLDKVEAIIPNIRALVGAMNVLAQDSQLVDRVMRKTANAAGALNEAFGARAQGPLFQFKQAWERLKASLLTLGQSIIPVILPLFERLAKAVEMTANAFAGLSTTTRTVIVVLGGLVAAIGPLLYSLGLFAQMTRFAMDGLVLFAPAINRVYRWLITLRAAFTGAALAGTGLRGVLIGLPTMLPIAGAVVAVALGILAKKFMDAKIAAEQAGQAAAEASAKFERLLTAVSPARARARVDQLNTRIAALRVRMRELTAQAGLATAAQAGASDATATHTPRIAENTEQTRLSAQAYLEQANAIGETVAVLEGHRNALQEIANLPVPEDDDPPGRGGTPLSEPIQEAMDAYQKALRQINVMPQLFTGMNGQTLELDVARARMDALREAIDALIAEGVGMNQVLDGQGTTLGGLIDQYRQAAVQVNSLEQSEQALEEQLAMRTAAWTEAQQVIENSLTPQEVYARTLERLNYFLHEGWINQTQFNRAVGDAKRVMDEALKKSNDFGTGLKMVFADALSSLMDFTQSGRNVFEQFVNDLIRAIQRLSAELLVTQLFKAMNISLPKFAHGGFLEPGMVGIAGEAGPELIVGGRSGVTVQPLRRMQLAAAGGGTSINLGGIHISAVDPQSFAELVAANPGAITGPVVKAIARSGLLQQALVR